MNLQEVKRLAKNHGIIGDIEISDKKDKKYVLIHGNKRIYFGARGYEDFLSHRDPERRRRFHQRFKNSRNYNTPYTSLYLSRKLLW